MKELKAETVVPQGSVITLQMYPKAETDKVIAEKDKEIQRLENLCESYRIDCDNLAIREANAYREIERDNKQIRHQKYRRCLAMAKVCKLKRFDAADYRIPRRKWDFYNKWLKRWLELAEKFKDKKEA